MTCPDAHLLTEFVENRLADDEHREWGAHFSECDPCAAKLALALKLREQGEAQPSAVPQTADVIEFAPHLTAELRRQRKRGLLAHSRWLPLLAAAALAGFFLMRPLPVPDGKLRNGEELGAVAIATKLLQRHVYDLSESSLSTMPVLSFKPAHSPAKEAYQAGYSLAHVTFLVSSGNPAPPSEASQPIASQLSSDHRQLLAELREGQLGTLDSPDLSEAVGLLEAELDRQLPPQYRKLGSWVFGADHSVRQRDETYFHSESLSALLVELEANGQAPGVKKLLEKIQFYAADGLDEGEWPLVEEHLMDISLLMQ